MNCAWTTFLKQNLFLFALKNIGLELRLNYDMRELHHKFCTKPKELGVNRPKMGNLQG